MNARTSRSQLRASPPIQLERIRKGNQLHSASSDHGNAYSKYNSGAVGYSTVESASGSKKSRVGTLCQPQRQALPQIGGATAPHHASVSAPSWRRCGPWIPAWSAPTMGKGAGGYSLQGGNRTETRLGGPLSPAAQHESSLCRSGCARSSPGVSPGNGDRAKRDANRPAKGARHDSRLK